MSDHDFLLSALAELDTLPAAELTGGPEPPSIEGILADYAVARERARRRGADAAAGSPSEGAEMFEFGALFLELGEGFESLAVDALEFAATSRPRDVSTRVALGEALFRAGRAAEGLAQLQASERLDPTSVEALVALAVGYILLGRSDDAAPLGPRIASLALDPETRGRALAYIIEQARRASEIGRPRD